MYVHCKTTARSQKIVSRTDIKVIAVPDSRSYCEMQEMTDEAVQRLYWACRRSSGFPGEIPDESQGAPSTSAIMDALGLRIPLLKDIGLAEDQQTGNQLSHLDCPSNASSAQRQRQRITPSTEKASVQNEYPPSPTHTAPTISPPAQSPKPQLSLATAMPQRSASATETNINEQFLYAESECSSSDHSTSVNHEKYPMADNSYSPAFDLVTHSDTSFYWTPASIAHPTTNIYPSMGSDIPAEAEIDHQCYPTSIASSQPFIICDGYLSPWPGSLAAAYHTTTTAH